MLQKPASKLRNVGGVLMQPPREILGGEGCRGKRKDSKLLGQKGGDLGGADIAHPTNWLNIKT